MSRLLETIAKRILIDAKLSSTLKSLTITLKDLPYNEHVYLCITAFQHRWTGSFLSHNGAKVVKLLYPEIKNAIMME